MTTACRLAGLAWVPVVLFVPACSSSAEGGSLADSGSGGGERDSSTGSAAPIPLEGTLFFTTTCDPSQGTDNLNDTGSTISSGSWTFWFIHHPDEINTSATWSLGNLSSGCVDYSTAPDC